MIEDRVQVEEYVRSLEEEDLWDLLKKFFRSCLKLNARRLHSTSEHGMDLVVKVDPKTDLLGIGYIVVIQSKVGKLRLADWRDVLGQLIETPYFSIPKHEVYSQCLARRLLLVISGSPTPEAQRGIDGFNETHDFKVEVWEIEKIIDEFDRWGFIPWMMTQIDKVGFGIAPDEPQPVVGEPTGDDQLSEDEEPSQAGEFSCPSSVVGRKA